MDFEALHHGNFASLGTAVDDWSSVVKRLEAMEKAAREDLKGKSDRANWAGVNATVTREFIFKTAGEFTDAVSQATSIRNILRDTCTELIKYRGQLRDAVERGWEKNLSVVGVKSGGFKVFINVHPEPEGSEQAMLALRDELQGILEMATTSDSTAARILKAIAEQADYGFSKSDYGDRDSAAEALKKADQVAKLAKDVEGMSPAQRATFNRTLAQYKDDELFAAQFATNMGAKGTLQFWTEMADMNAGMSGTDLKELESFQENFSMTLATATLSDANGMQEWKRNVIDEGNTNFRSNPSDPFKGGTGALGVQVMSSLMNHGTYDTEFLDAFGKKVLKADMAVAGSPGMGTNDVWKGANHGIDLVFGKDDGRDPVNGLMKAMSHNPEAATNMFDDKTVLDHVLESTKHTDRGGPVGLALEAAVTGVADGEKPTEPAPHSKTQVEIMKNVMHAVAQPDGGADLVTEATGESFGDMAAAYMPEISRALAGPGENALFPTNSAYLDDWERTDVSRFLYEVSTDPMGEASIIIGESIYTASVLEAHIANPSLFDGSTEEAIKGVATNAGLIEGIVGRSVADEKITEGLDAEAADNESLKQKGDFVKAVLSAGVGVGTVALVPVSAIGAAAGAAGSGFFGGIAGMAVDRLMGEQQAEGALDRSLYQTGRTLNGSLESATLQTQASAADAIKAHNSELPEVATDVLINQALEAGWADSDTILEDVHVRPSA